jgi:nucleoside-diphosphate-sugar epimerase
MTPHECGSWDFDTSEWGADMRILVTGGAGFLGSHICDRLLMEGDEVICMDHLITGTTDNIAHLAGHPRFSFIHHGNLNIIYEMRQNAACLLIWIWER